MVGSRIIFISASIFLAQTCLAVTNCTSISNLVDSNWCERNCKFTPPYCPQSYCTCSNSGQPTTTPTPTAKTCVAISSATTDQWCTATCNMPNPVCPSDWCLCSGGSQPQQSSHLTCVSIHVTATNEWCSFNCPAYCPAGICSCSNATTTPTPTAVNYTSICPEATDNWCQAVCSNSPTSSSCLACCVVAHTANVSTPTPTPQPIYHAICVTATDDWCQALCTLSPNDQNCINCCVNLNQGSTPSGPAYYPTCPTATQSWCQALCWTDPEDQNCLACCTKNATITPAPSANVTYFATCTTASDSWCQSVCTANPTADACTVCCTSDAAGKSNNTKPVYVATCSTGSDSWCQSVCSQNPGNDPCWSCCGERVVGKHLFYGGNANATVTAAAFTQALSIILQVDPSTITSTFDGPFIGGYVVSFVLVSQLSVDEVFALLGNINTTPLGEQIGQFINDALSDSVIVSLSSVGNGYYEKIITYCTTLSQVVNGDFETGDLTGWDSFNLGGVSSGPAARTGTYGMYFAEAFDFAYIWQTVTVLPGHSYTVSFWLNVEGPPPNAGMLLLNANPCLILTDVPNSNFEFTQYSCTFVAEGLTYSLQIMLAFSSQQGFMEVDDVTIVDNACPVNP